MEINLRVYKLKLEENKWWIGKTTNLKSAIQRHEKGFGPPWTFIYKPLGVEDVIENGDLKEITLNCMREYGWQNVRGYAWSQWNMKNPPKELRDVLEPRKLKGYSRNDEYLISILKLENSKWYIGKTTNIKKELKLHRQGLKSSFTSINKVKKVEDLIKNGNFEKIISNYKKQYGEENVHVGVLKSENKIINEKKRKNDRFIFKTNDGTLLKLKTENLKSKVRFLKNCENFMGLYALGCYFPADRYPSLHDHDYFTNRVLELKEDNNEVASEVIRIFLHFINNSINLQTIFNKIKYVVMMPTTRAINHLKQWGVSLINKFKKQDITDFVSIVEEKKKYFNYYKFKSPWDRKDAVNGAFIVDTSKLLKKTLKNEKYLILDDVYTTGSQIYGLSKVLIAEGAKEVYALVIAKTKSYV